ncbi:hypothetical protein [Streptomyces sp. NPDC056948]|uniref:hypothetical protein n=1 Tax=Streptomyces sp. NPDC056948 TaxID=3345975 RepID=UPI0036324175
MTRSAIAATVPSADQPVLFVGIPASAAPCRTAAHGDLHWANLTAPLRILDWEGFDRY